MASDAPVDVGNTSSGFTCHICGQWIYDSSTYHSCFRYVPAATIEHISDDRIAVALERIAMALEIANEQ